MSKRKPVYAPGYLTLKRQQYKAAQLPWRLSLDKAAWLMRLVADQMLRYSEERGPHWHQTVRAELFHECLHDLIELQEQLDELRSNF